MIKKPLSCKLKSSKISSDLDCLLINKIVRLLLIGMVSILSAQTAIIKNSIIGYTTIGDTVSFATPHLWTLLKSDD